MDDGPEDEGEAVRPRSDEELVRESKLSPHLRAAIGDWRRERGEGDARRVPTLRVLIELTGRDSSELDAAGVRYEHLFGTFYGADVALDRLEQLADLPTVHHIHRERSAEATLDDSIPEIRASTVRNPQHPFSGTDKFTGQGVVIGIIDSGINYRHPVFRRPDDQSKSRILAILDQTVTPPVTYTRAQIEAAIASNTDLIQPGAMIGGVRQVTPNTDHDHGTHVAGIAAGNGFIAGACSGQYKYVGVAPEADLVAVKFNFTDGVSSVTKAIQFCANTAAAVPPDGAPCVINMSFGHSIGPHDGTDPMDKAIEDYLLVRDLLPGKPVVLVASAGNSGGHENPMSGPQSNGEDSHAAGNIPPGGVVQQLKYRLPPQVELRATGTLQTSVEIRYTAPIGLGCRLIPPGNNITGSNLAPPNGAATFTENTRGSTCNIRSTLDAPGKRRINIVVTSVAGNHNQKGDWTIELTNAGAAPIGYHAWIYGPQFERFTGADLSRQTTVGSPGSAPRVITVGNYAPSGKDKGEIADSSSRGPLLDAASTQKPDLSAPGVEINSARRDYNDSCCCDCCCDSYKSSTGTSQAAPHVTGAIALMLQRNPELTHDQVKAILMSNARRDSYTGAALPDNTFGNGKLDTLALLNDPQVRGAGVVIASSSAGESRTAVIPQSPPLPPLPQLEEGTPLWRLLNTAEGQKVYQRGRVHWEEVRTLVNTEKRVATVWHRNHGPLLLHHVTRTVMLPHVPLPREIDGEEVSIRAARLVSALERFASKELVAALHATLPLIAELQGKTLLEVVEHFEAMDPEEVLQRG